MAVQPIYNQNPLAVIETPTDYVKTQITKIRTLQKTIKELLTVDYDYGKIPGCGDKPTLFKPGAEKILMAFGLQSDYELIQSTEKFEGNGFFSYTVKSIISSNGVKITEGMGHANSKETKFAYKWVTEKNIPDGVDKSKLVSRTKNGSYGTYKEYRICEDMNSKANTILKMAKKRAQVDAVLTVASLSELFTQDFDDLTDDEKTPQGKVEEIKEQLKGQQAQGQTQNNCEACQKAINEATVKFSQEKFGKPLCYSCQQKFKKQNKS